MKKLTITSGRAGDGVGEQETELGQYPEYFYKRVSKNVGHFIKQQCNYFLGNR